MVNLLIKAPYLRFRTVPHIAKIVFFPTRAYSSGSHGQLENPFYLNHIFILLQCVLGIYNFQHVYNTSKY